MKSYTVLLLAGLHCIAVLFFSCATAEVPGPMEADATASGMGVPAQITNLEVAKLVKEWEQALRQTEELPPQAAILAISLDGVMAPVRQTDGTFGFVPQLFFDPNVERQNIIFYQI